MRYRQLVGRQVALPPECTRRLILVLPSAVLTMVLISRGVTASVLDMELIPQRGSFWCWAASAEMTLDYLAPTKLYRDAVGQCSLVRSLGLQPQCDCPCPDGFNAASPACEQADPFGQGDFLPGLLGDVKKTSQNSTNLAPIDRDLLTYEVDTRKRPIIAWWGDGDCQYGQGHLVVSSGVERNTARGDLVLILDPQPIQTGDRYWLTWRGFSCGSFLGGHCVDYYDLQGTAAPPKYPATVDLDGVGCGSPAVSFEKIHEISESAEIVNRLLQGETGVRLRKGLGAPGQNGGIECDLGIRVHGARIAFDKDAGAVPSKIGTTRLLCDLQGDSGRVPASIFLIDRGPEEWLLAGFGAPHTSQWIRRTAEIVRKQKGIAAGTPKVPIIDLYEVEVPGTGDLLLVVPDPAAGYPAFHFQAELGLAKDQRPLRDVLKESVGNAGSRTLESWLRGLKSARFPVP